MNPAVFALFSLAVTSAMLAAILLIAWAGFGRPRHALIWAAAYGVAAVEWTVNLAALGGWVNQVVSRPLILTLAAIVTLLLTLGFRHRAELRLRLVPFGLITGACVAICFAGALAWPGGATDRAAFPLFLALMQMLGATTLVGRGHRPNPAESAAFAVLIASALFDLAVGVLALSQGPAASPGELIAYRAMLLFGTPTAFTAIGLFIIFLLAGDLSEKMRRLAILDPLTGVLNRRGLEQAARAAIANAHRFGQPLSVVMADLDRFKAINDSFGHSTGDRVLQRFAVHMSDTIRGGDLFGRIGGEEFALILINTPAAVAMEVTERIRAEVKRLDTGTEGLRLTSSFGVTELAPGDIVFTDLLGRADAALYRAKLAGRNRVSLAVAPADDGAVAPPAAPRRPVPLR